MQLGALCPTLKPNKSQNGRQGRARRIQDFI